MTDRALWIIGPVAGGIALIAILWRMSRYRKLHNQWVTEMNAQAEVPFADQDPQEDPPDRELLTRPR